jgi:copper transport protein
LIVILAALLFATAVYAHVVPVGCVPRAGVNLSAPPPQVLCLFSDTLDLTKSNLEVLDAQGNRVDRGDAKPFQDDPTSLLVTLDTAAMEAGVYTIVWTTADFIDRDVISGTIEFGVNTIVPPTPTAVLPGAVITPQPTQPATNATADLISRFLIGLGVALLAAMGFLFWRMRRRDVVREDLEDASERVEQEK